MDTIMLRANGSGARTLPCLRLAVLALAWGTLASAAKPPFLPTPPLTVSTVPANGDVNPYGVAFVPNNYTGGGALNVGDILVSNFNNNQNLQGTGTTIVRLGGDGTTSLFFQGTPPLGLTTALAVLRAGVVIVGNLPTADGTSATAQPGSLLIVNGDGQQVATLTDPLINGPWDMAVDDRGDRARVFVSNVLNGTVSRFDLAVSAGTVSVEGKTQIASGYQHRGDPAALEVGPTGLVFDSRKNALYVASTGDNAVFKIEHAGNTSADQGTGKMIYQDPAHLHGALAMAKAPNGDLLVSNSDVVNGDPAQPSEIVEFTTAGTFVKQLPVDPAQGGSFGLAVATSGDAARFAAVDDNAVTLTVWTLPVF